MNLRLQGHYLFGRIRSGSLLRFQSEGSLTYPFYSIHSGRIREAPTTGITPYSLQTLQRTLGYLERKIVQPYSGELNALRSRKQVKPSSQKQFQRPQNIDRASIELELYLWTTLSWLTSIHSNCEGQRLAKQQKANKA